MLTRADVPGTDRQGIMHKDQPVLCGERVRHCGDPVALVVAKSREALGFDSLRVRVRAPYLGGSFDGKDGATVQCLMALAALSVPRRWVKMVWPREETFQAGYKSHGTVMDVHLGAHANVCCRRYAARCISTSARMLI